MVLLGIDTQKDIVAAGQTTGSDITVVAGYVVFLGGLAPIGWRIMIGRTEQARA